MSMLEQLRNNQLAIISLLVALMALGYNTWRNELTEENRTIRQAGFEMVVHLSDLQRIAYLAHYDNDTVGGNPRKGWAEVLVLKDLSLLMPAEVTAATTQLAEVWEANWAALGDKGNQGAVGDEAIAALDTALDELRAQLQSSLRTLD